ncbi:MAG: P-loop containing nucleoside triphosphate hydrolase protein [Piptocephalis tieghemiana]|nr:MAG: P-loop containing nucleoside triphosphate hydrolase protein [Piptocephalis tieghemiana]
MMRADLHAAFSRVSPSELAAFSTKAPDISFDMLFGLDTCITELKSVIRLSLKSPHLYTSCGIRSPKGILVHGPSGTGKSKLCMALAHEMNINFVHVKATSIRSMMVGESEKAVVEMFQRARSAAPCFLFIDQIDSLLSQRGQEQSSEGSSDRIVTCFLTATNRKEALDKAILRPGRFDYQIHLPLPGPRERSAIINGLSKRMPLRLSDTFMEQLVQESEGQTGKCILR